MSGGWLPAGAVERLRDALSEPDLSGTRFELAGRLGSGGMGTVWLARDRELQREVALKVLAQPLEPEEAQARLLREARILARLEHPGIVPVHDAGLLPDGRAWYAMKRVRGRRLDEHLATPRGLDERLRIFERLCDALAFAHAQGVLHRDLKPANVMVGEFGEVLLLDWGVAKLAGEAAGAEPGGPASPAGAETSPGTILGTPGFMPPEQAEGRSAEADERSDAWGLGAILHVLLRGAPPPPELPPERFGPDVPTELEAICRRALRRRPEDRYASVAALRQDLLRFREGLAVQALPEGPLRALLRLGQRYRVAIVLVAAYLVVRVAVALVMGR